MAQVDSWQEKYLKSLDEQDRLEQLNTAQAHLIRRIAVNLCAAAAGLDPELDEAMQGLKEKLRGAKGSAVHDQLILVEHAVRSFTDRRDGLLKDMLGSMKMLIESLNGLVIPEQLKVTLRQQIKHISQQQRDPTLLSIAESLPALESLHQQALIAAQVTEIGLWQRLRGRKRLRGATDDSGPSNQQKVDIEDNDRYIDAEVERCDENSGWPEARAVLTKSVQAILAEFNQTERASEVWGRANAFLPAIANWLDFTVVFEDLRNLLAARSLGADAAIALYLEQLNEDLNELCKQLGLNLRQQEQHDQAAKQLEQSVTEQVADMRTCVDRAESLEGLKSDIRSQVSLLQQAIEQFQQQTERQTQADELQKLMEKVQLMESESARTQKLLEEQSYKALHDALTELPNREAYNQRVQQEWQRFTRYGGALCLALVDIDHFKQLNDQFGHRVGDRVLKVIAQSLRQRLRTVDFIARYGGEEFIVLLPETELHDAIKLLDQIRDGVATAPFRVKSNPIQITFSSGVSAFREGDKIDSVVERADRALYRAKNDGRNRVCRGDD